MKITLSFSRTHKGYHQFTGLKQLVYFPESSFPDGAAVKITVEGDTLALAPVAVPLTEAEKVARAEKLRAAQAKIADELKALAVAVPAKKTRLVKKPVAAVAPVADGAAAQ